jgi:hypothetical protein
MQRATHPLSANKTKGENEMKKKDPCYEYKSIYSDTGKNICK